MGAECGHRRVIPPAGTCRTRSGPSSEVGDAAWPVRQRKPPVLRVAPASAAGHRSSRVCRACPVPGGRCWARPSGTCGPRAHQHGPTREVPTAVVTPSPDADRRSTQRCVWPCQTPVRDSRGIQRDAWRRLRALQWFLWEMGVEVAGEVPDGTPMTALVAEAADITRTRSCWLPRRLDVGEAPSVTSAVKRRRRRSSCASGGGPSDLIGGRHGGRSAGCGVRGVGEGRDRAARRPLRR